MECARKANAKYAERYPKRRKDSIDRSLAKNHQRILERQRADYVKNQKRRIAKSRRWNIANADKVAAREAKRRATQERATPSWADRAAIEAVYAECARITRETGIAHHVDHIVPLRGKRVTGLHVHYNLQILDARVNMAKGNRMIPAEGVRPKRLPRQPDLFLGVAA